MQQPPYGGPPQQPFGQPGYQQTQWPQQQPGYPGQGQWPGQFQQPPKKKGNGCLTAGIVGAVVLVGSCGVLVAVSRGSSSSNKPGTEKVSGSIPASKKEYEGSWLGPGVALHIAHDGTLNYQRKTGGKNSSINGIKIDRFEKDNFVVDFFFTNTTFVVSEPPKAPAEKDGKWKMTVDGIELERFAGPDEAKVDHGVRVNCKPTANGTDCTATHSGGIHDIKACYDIVLTCKNGKSPKQNRCEDIEIGGKKEHSFLFTEIDPGKECDQMTDYNVKNIDLDAK